MKKILIADDSLFMRTVIKDILGERYAIIEASSGKGCLEQFDRAAPDLVLLDVVMPEGQEEGLRVLKQLMKKDPRAKVVMITALGQQAVVVGECLANGAKSCIAKPFEEAQVLRTVEENLR